MDLSIAVSDLFDIILSFCLHKKTDCNSAVVEIKPWRSTWLGHVLKMRKYNIHNVV